MSRIKLYRRAYLGGTFDCLHRGHLALFTQARLIAKDLVVSVNTDEFAASYKRKPLMSLDDRIAVLEACRLVDAVIVNVGGYDSKIAIVAANVDCIVHGSDWQGPSLMRQMALTEDWLAENKISLEILQYTKGISTTMILDSLKDKGDSVVDETVTMCKGCNRAVYKTDLDNGGNCSTCISQPHKPTEAEWADLGRQE